jgi:protein-disulfide isomerase
MIQKKYTIWFLVVLFVVLGVALFGTDWIPAGEPSASKGVDEKALLQRIKGAVMKELRESDFLQKEVDAGIERYIRKQQQAQARAPDLRAEKNVRPVSKERDHIYGNPDAEISLIEYSDFECPFCKRFHPTPKQIVKAYQGKVNWVYRHFPLGFHNPLAQKEAEASECVAELGGNDAFWKYSDLLYQRTKSNGNGFPMSGLAPLAGEIGLDEKEIQLCIDSGRYEDRIQDDYANGGESGVSGTPGNILLNNETGRAKIMSGALPFKALKIEIDQLLQG